MSTYTQILYQIVFSTKHREPVLERQHRPALFQYISGIIKKKNCHLYQINGVEDHLHILTHLHPSLALSDLVKDIKTASSKHIKERLLYTDFIGWQEGYGAFTYSMNSKVSLINYIKNQEAHHRTLSFRNEFEHLLKDNEIVFDPQYLL